MASVNPKVARIHSAGQEGSPRTTLGWLGLLPPPAPLPHSPAVNLEKKPKEVGFVWLRSIYLLKLPNSHCVHVQQAGNQVAKEDAMPASGSRVGCSSGHKWLPGAHEGGRGSAWLRLPWDPLFEDTRWPMHSMGLPFPAYSLTFSYAPNRLIPLKVINRKAGSYVPSEKIVDSYLTALQRSGKCATSGLQLEGLPGAPGSCVRTLDRNAAEGTRPGPPWSPCLRAPGDSPPLCPLGRGK